MNDSKTNDSTETRSAHTFHIPVLGTGFSIDTPLKVAKYGISSVISLVDDVLIEQVRQFYCKKHDEPYNEIAATDKDARAKRITAYLNLVDKLVNRQVEELQASPFEKDSEITKYYEMLPDCPLKDTYTEMLKTEDEGCRAELQAILREKAVPGSIDVNIMTKLDVPHFNSGELLSREYNDAMAALRGYAESTLKSALVLSAGINQHLYSYIAEFKDFIYNRKDILKKQIVLKVSDYRSAVTQGKFLAKKGIWVSEFRIESGLNCGGHAFATKGMLMGPILDEFKRKKDELIDKLHVIYSKALDAMNIESSDSPLETRLTVQGGICTHEEAAFLSSRYSLDGTGWGTPFLLVPECVNIDNDSLNRLCQAGRDDTELSKCSPVGIPYWNLKTSASEDGRRQRISEGKPGVPCPKGYLTFNDEFTQKPVCTASKSYQSRKLKALSKPNGLTEAQKEKIREDVLAKSCICHELGGSTTINLGIDKSIRPNICPGPIIGYFSKPMNLREIVDHIYGRISLVQDSDRPHMFLDEMRIYLDHLLDEAERVKLEISYNTPVYLSDFRDNMLEAVKYYREISESFVDEQKERFTEELNVLQQKLESLNPLQA